MWFDGRVVYAPDCGELDFEENRVARKNKVAQECQIVCAVELDEQGKFADDKEPEYVEGQYNIHDSVPGMEDYSPPWQFNHVVVGRDYEPNSLRSEADCLAGGYRLERSTVAENRPVLQAPRTTALAVRVKDGSLSEGDQTWLT